MNSTSILPTHKECLHTSCTLAADYLRAGELVAFPTETVYGLGADLFNCQALSKIFLAKGRPSDNPLIAHISSIEQASDVCIDIPEEFYLLAKHFFPGPLTIVLKKQQRVPLLASGGQESIAVRMPNHPVAQLLLKKVGVPLAAPSANLSGKPSSVTSAHVYEDFKGKIAAILEGGECLLGIESTVLSLLNPDQPLLLRPGRVTLEELEAVLKRPLLLAGKETPLLSPGMRYKHYAPLADVKLFSTWEELLHYIHHSPLRKRSILARENLGESRGESSSLLSGATLYSQLRQADHNLCAEVLILCDAEVQNDRALLNRLQRAACL